MLLTEKEVRKIRCCEALEWEQVSDCTHLDTIVGAVPEAKKCISSGCMAWWWLIESTRKYDSDRGTCGEWVAAPQSEWEGYCGKAGKP